MSARHADRLARKGCHPTEPRYAPFAVRRLTCDSCEQSHRFRARCTKLDLRNASTRAATGARAAHSSVTHSELAATAGAGAADDCGRVPTSAGDLASMPIVTEGSYSSETVIRPRAAVAFGRGPLSLASWWCCRRQLSRRAARLMTIVCEIVT